MQMTERRRTDPSELTIQDAAERFIGRRRGSRAEATIREYGYRLNRFREFCDQAGIETVGDLHPLDFDDYLAAREAAGVKPVTLQKHFGTIRAFVEFCEALGAVDDGLHRAVPDIDVPRGVAVDDQLLEPDDGDALIRHYRNSEARASREHAVLEVIWTTGCRRGAIRGLDLGDFDARGQALAFRHRPNEGTPLKKGADGERVVALSDAVTAVLDEYVTTHRHEIRDEHGRQPLFTTTRGRPAANTVQNWCYQVSQPCVRIDCPHGKQRASCDWRQYTKASQCPSSRGPTAIKSGAITRMLNRTSKERVRHRANTSQWQNYDLASQREKMEQRDRETVPDIAVDETQEADSE